MMVDDWRGFRLRNDKPKGLVGAGSSIPNVKYEQGGYFFSSTGECIGKSQSPKPEMFIGISVVEPVSGGGAVAPKPQNPEPDGKIDANEIYYKDLNATIMEMSDAGSNATEIHAHLQHNGTDITWQKIASIVRKEKKKRLEDVGYTQEPVGSYQK